MNDFKVGTRVGWTNGLHSFNGLTIVEIAELDDHDRDMIVEYAPEHLKIIDLNDKAYLLERDTGERAWAFLSNITYQS